MWLEILQGTTCRVLGLGYCRVLFGPFYGTLFFFPKDSAEVVLGLICVFLVSFRFFCRFRYDRESVVEMNV